jgi:ubiquinone/menaquinone biosynthesis C-methylase UbiE
MLTSKELQKKYFKSSEHPYRKYENQIESILDESFTILDAGCGRTAPILSKFKDKAQRLIGVDLEEPIGILNGIQYIKGDIANIDVPSNSVHVVISRAVLEHVIDPNSVFKEINRILKSEGNFIFLVPNLFDYVSIASKIIPNRFHKIIVSKTEGREMDDVFPAYYKANTYKTIERLSDSNKFAIESFEWLGQYPSSLMFNPYLFLIGKMYEKAISRFELLRFLRGWLLVNLRKHI